MSNYIVTEYSEELEDLSIKKSSISKLANFATPGTVVRNGGNAEDNLSSSAKDKDIVESYFSEGGDEDHDHHDDEEVTFSEVDVDQAHPEGYEYVEYSEGGSSVDVVEGDAEEILEEVEEAISEIGEKIPGVEVAIVKKEEEEEEETTWEKHKDPSKFMAYITKAYPHGIPRHDGQTTLGCERAIHYLKGLDSEISRALREDAEHILDVKVLEPFRVDINKDIVTLENHVKDMKKNRRYNKRASAEVELLIKEAEIEKVASTPSIQLVMTPFERAISGIITNAVVSAGKPFEDVFEFLKEKYSLDEREELAIFQILKDMGHPIFKDRGVLGKPKGSKEEKAQGVEFIKNYFA